MIKKQKILFTGSLGFIFSNFIRKVAYEKEPYTFCGLDKAVNKKYLNNIYNNNIIESNYIANTYDEHIVNNIFDIEKPDIVIHAASVRTNGSHLKDAECINTNMLGTKVLIDAAKRTDVKKIFYLTDSAKYSCLGSITKEAAKDILKISDLNYSILNICNLYGPRQTNDHLVPAVIKTILHKEKLLLPLDGMRMIDWMHVFDFSNALLTILKKSEDNSEYNISAGQELSVVETTQMICNIMKDGHDLLSYTDNKKDKNYKYETNNDRLRELGWRPMFKLKKGIEETVEWYIANQWALK